MTARLDLADPPVWIVELDGKFEKVEWLCDAHIEAAERNGWKVKRKRAPFYPDPPLVCLECR